MSQLPRRSSAELLVLGVLAVTVLLLILAWPFQSIWNYTVVGVFDGVHEINYWRSFFLLLLTYIVGRLLAFGNESSRSS